MRVDGQPGTNALMLPLAYSIGVILNTFLHWIMFEKSYRGFSKPVLETFFHSLSASIIMGYVSFICLRAFSLVFPLEKVWGIFMQGFCSGIIGFARLKLKAHTPMQVYSGFALGFLIEFLLMLLY